MPCSRWTTSEPVQPLGPHGAKAGRLVRFHGRPRADPCRRRARDGACWLAGALPRHAGHELGGEIRPQPLPHGAHGGRHGCRLPHDGAGGRRGRLLHGDGCRGGAPLRRGQDLEAGPAAGARARHLRAAVRVQARPVPRGGGPGAGAPGRAAGAHRREHGLPRAQGDAQGGGVRPPGRPGPGRADCARLPGGGPRARHVQDSQGPPHGGARGGAGVREGAGGRGRLGRGRARQNRQPALPRGGRLGHGGAGGPGGADSRHRVWGCEDAGGGRPHAAADGGLGRHGGAWVLRQPLALRQRAQDPGG